MMILLFFSSLKHYKFKVHDVAADWYSTSVVYILEQKRGIFFCMLHEFTQNKVGNILLHVLNILKTINYEYVFSLRLPRPVTILYS